MHSLSRVDWVRLYRQGVSCASIAVLSQVHTADVVRAIATAQSADASLEPEHAANTLRYARQIWTELAREEALPPSWNARFQDLKAFVRAHGSMPRRTADDAAENALARWLQAQRDKVALDPRQRSALDGVGDWDPERKAPGVMSRFPEKLRALAGFRTSHGRWPTPVNSGDQHECVLGQWLLTLREAASDGRLPEDLRKNLDKALPDWNP